MKIRDGYAQSAVGLIPRDWACKPLADFLSFISYGFTNPMPTVADGVYMITAADIDHGKIQLASARRTSITSFQKLLTAKSKPRANDVLLTKDGSLGRLALVGEEVICINQSVAVLRVNEKVEPNFLKILLESTWYQTRMLEDAGGSTIKHIYITIVDKMPIGLPLDKPEQRAITTALSDVDVLIAGLEKLIAKKRDLKQAAMQQLLTGQTRLPGFSGEWAVKRIDEVAEVDPENLDSATKSDYQFKYISLEDVDRGRLLGHSEQVLSTSPSRARRKLRDEDILVSTVRPNLQSHLLFRYDTGEWVCSTGFSVVRCKTDQAYPGFIYAHLFAYGVNQQIEALLTGSNYPAINGSDVRALQIPFPEVEEQKAIAMLLTGMDSELVSLESRLAKTRDLKQGMMQELLTGRTRLIKVSEK